MIHNKYFKIVALGLLLSSTACDPLDVEPQASLPAETALDNRTGAEAGLIGAYSALQSVNYMGLRYFTFADLTADNAIHSGTFPSFAQISQQNILPDNVELSNMWNAIYAGINRANNLIANVPNVDDPAFNQESVLGQARFLRAYHYFNLINYFGGSTTGFGDNGLGVPLRTEPTITPEDANPTPRASEAEVIALVLEDLDYAIANLPESFAGAAGKGRATQAAALALKSRVQLYQGNYQDAAELAQQVIESERFTLVDNYQDIYEQRNTAESIWELQFDPVNDNSIAFFWLPTGLGGRNEVSPSPDLAAAHEEGDERLNTNVLTPTYTGKYTRISDGTDHVMLIRYAEVLLNRAEALARLGGIENLLEATSLLNEVRERAELAPVVELTQEALIDAILQERRIELANEGHRWFDLRRTQRAAEELEITDPNRLLWPIPQREVLNSEDLVEQNPGY
ncbi:RagB/SusD family nutrient uptake outer membrane protein [Pontibacter diazotrophicus]|uniref:RagB/SusD family nutrient uptake outer membrane protein n=1 Tax=Pontibacter diazotrophicus TaxID=1400979 RepID=A0A3D8LEE0_9BACT|nr:RagB/SusD family nutrient uptake outer membrane protein [Pontibacter diazotrophicus]RDV15644.1 RagB/SusD family nutrient uptake outer membrane protein [Pontibacter diazotrophicus]